MGHFGDHVLQVWRPNQQWKHWRRVVSHPDSSQSHQAHLTMLQRKQINLTQRTNCPRQEHLEVQCFDNLWPSFDTGEELLLRRTVLAKMRWFILFCTTMTTSLGLNDAPKFAKQSANCGTSNSCTIRSCPSPTPSRNTNMYFGRLWFTWETCIILRFTNHVTGFHRLKRCC